jgi:hypothetical protein
VQASFLVKRLDTDQPTTILKRKGKAYSDLPSLVRAVESDELASPMRSTVPLLAYWYNPTERYKELSTHFGLTGC